MACRLIGQLARARPSTIRFAAVLQDPLEQELMEEAGVGAHQEARHRHHLVPVHQLPDPALQRQVGRRHPDRLEIDHRGIDRAGAELVEDLEDADAGALLLHQDGGHLAVQAQGDEAEVGVVAVDDVELAGVDHQLAAVARGRRRHRPAGLGVAGAADQPAGDHLGEIAVAHLLAVSGRQPLAGDLGLAVDAEGDAEVPELRRRLAEDQRPQQAEAAAPQLAGERDAEEPLAAELRPLRLARGGRRGPVSQSPRLEAWK